MAPLPPLTPSPPDPQGSRVPARTRSSLSEEIAGGSGSAEIILAKLRGMIARGGQETDIILGTICVAAHALTGANGAAIAMPRGGAVVCVGRSGEIAPELGDLLNLDSGISGECVRTGRIMRCDDASRDFHVDADVCRQLNLQSIAVVPTRGRQGRVGVLETFSSRSYAFTEEHMDLLGRLAGLAESAWSKGVEEQELRTTEEPASTSRVSTSQPDVRQALDPPSATQEAEVRAAHTAQSFYTESSYTESSPDFSETAETHALAPSRLSVASEALTRVVEAITTGLHTELENKRKRRYWTIVAVGAALLCLISVVGWKVWYKASLPTRTAHQQQGVASDTADGAPGVGLARESGAGSHPSSATLARGSASGKASSHGLASTGSAVTGSHAPHAPAVGSAQDTTVKRRLFVQGEPDRSQSATSPVEAPRMPQTDVPGTELGGLLPASPALPKLTVPISQGVSGGLLVRKVQPVYPSEARQLHLKGTVVLAAIINEQGQIEGLKVISGSPVLAAAAMDAVRKWRYTPYLLNGKPVRKETEINITFIPQ